jgi:membrane protease YdiL (CAAX protease family)
MTHLVNPVAVEIARVLFPALSFSFPMSGLNERSILGQYGGSLAAMFLVIKLYGVRGFRATLSHSQLSTESARWLVISFLMPLLIILISYRLAGVGFDDLLSILFGRWQWYLLVIGGFVISSGLAEEYGWRGFLLPQLLKSTSPLRATLTICLLVSLWHFPALIAGWKGEPLVPWLILCFPIAIMHSWLFFRSKGNLIVTILFHACFDAQYSFFSTFIRAAGIEHQASHQGWAFVALNCFVGLVIIVATRGTLGFNAKDFSIRAYFGANEPAAVP